MQPILYLVVPCYNEEEVLPETVHRLTDKLDSMTQGGIISGDSRMIFVDDGSKDKTWQLIEAFHKENPYVCGLKLSRNRGHQNALLAGLMHAKEPADCVISLDADLQDDVDAIDRFVEKYTEGCDVVYGVRNKRETDTFFKRTTARGFYTFMKKMGVDVVYDHADYRLMSRRALEALADSIRQYGLIQPITVRKLDSGYYQIIAGERRWRASRLAGLTEVPVRVIEADDRRTAELALVENLQREDLNPIEEAKGYKLLIEEYGLTQEDAARSVGRSRPAVTNAMRLLMLTPPVMEMVEKGKLSAGHARAILSVSEPSKQLAAANEIIKKNYSVRKAEQLAARIAREPRQAPEESGEISVDYAAEISNELSKKLGRKVKLIDGKRNGKIEIEFYGADDREALIEKLLKL